MKITDVIAVVARSPLSAYPWGQEVVDLVNAYVATEFKITLKDNGTVIQGRIDTIGDASVKQFLLNKNISAEAPPAGKVETDLVDYALPKGYIRDYRPFVTGVIALGLVMVCLVLAVGTDIQQPKGSKRADGVIDIFLRVGKAVTRAVKNDDPEDDTGSVKPVQSPQKPADPSQAPPAQ
jgi:hypothetical protein